MVAATAAEATVVVGWALAAQQAGRRAVQAAGKRGCWRLCFVLSTRVGECSMYRASTGRMTASTSTVIRTQQAVGLSDWVVGALGHWGGGVRKIYKPTLRCRDWQLHRR